MLSSSSFSNLGNTEIKNVNSYGIILDGGIINSGTINIENLSNDFEVYILGNGNFLNEGSLRLK